jgi:hypothetical protein
MKAIIVTADRAASYCYRTKFRQLFERNRTVAASAFRTVKLNSVPGNESYYSGRRQVGAYGYGVPLDPVEFAGRALGIMFSNGMSCLSSLSDQ